MSDSSDWIKCEDEAPLSDIDEVLVYVEDGICRYYTIAEHNGGLGEYSLWINQSGKIIDGRVVAWMPIEEFCQGQERFDEMWDEMESKEDGL